MNKITTNIIIETNKQICMRLNNTFGIRDKNLLESIIPNSRQSVFNQDAYPTIKDKITFIVTSIIKNYCFIDGNKRTAFIIFTILCSINNIKISNIENVHQAILKIVNSKFDIEQNKNLLFL